MKRKIAVILLWVVCGIYNWGTAMADLKWHSENLWTSLHPTARDHAGMCALMALGGPFGTAAVALVTNFNQHGWTMWYGESR